MSGSSGSLIDRYEAEIAKHFHRAAGMCCCDVRFWTPGADFVTAWNRHLAECVARVLADGTDAHASGQQQSGSVSSGSVEARTTEPQNVCDNCCYPLVELAGEGPSLRIAHCCGPTHRAAAVAYLESAVKGLAPSFGSPSASPQTLPMLPSDAACGAVFRTRHGYPFPDDPSQRERFEMSAITGELEAAYRVDGSASPQTPTITTALSGDDAEAAALVQSLRESARRDETNGWVGRVYLKRNAADCIERMLRGSASPEIPRNVPTSDHAAELAERVQFAADEEVRRNGDNEFAFDLAAAADLLRNFQTRRVAPEIPEKLPANEAAVRERIARKLMAARGLDWDATNDANRQSEMKQANNLLVIVRSCESGTSAPTLSEDVPSMESAVEAAAQAHANSYYVKGAGLDWSEMSGADRSIEMDAMHRAICAFLAEPANQRLRAALLISAPPRQDTDRKGATP